MSDRNCERCGQLVNVADFDEHECPPPPSLTLTREQADAIASIVEVARDAHGKRCGDPEHCNMALKLDRALALLTEGK